MNNKNQGNGVLTGPLIFTVPAYGFVMALYLDWLGRPNRAAFCAKTDAEEIESIEPRRTEPPEQTNQEFDIIFHEII